MLRNITIVTKPALMCRTCRRFGGGGYRDRFAIRPRAAPACSLLLQKHPVVWCGGPGLDRGRAAGRRWKEARDEEETRERNVTKERTRRRTGRRRTPSRKWGGHHGGGGGAQTKVRQAARSGFTSRAERSTASASSLTDGCFKQVKAGRLSRSGAVQDTVQEGEGS